MDQRLRDPIQLQWKNVPSGEALERLAASYQIGIFLDRRIDPSMPLQTEGTFDSMERFFELLAEQQKWSVTRVGPVMYLGPPSSAARVRAHYQQQLPRVRRLPASVRQRWLRSRPVTWQDFTEPRQLIRQWADETSVRIDGMEHLPYDLWAARSLPPLPLLDRLSLVLAGFDRYPDVQPDGSVQLRTSTPAPIARQPYTLSADQQQRLETLTQQLPPGSWRVERQALIVEGTAEVHDRVQQWMTRSTPRKPAQPQLPRNPVVNRKSQRFTLTAQDKPLAAVLAAVATQSGLELQVSDDAQDTQSARISVQVQNATLEQLLEEVCQAGGVRFELKPPKLLIFPDVARRPESDDR